MSHSGNLPCLLLLATTLTATSAFAQAPATWPQWRGPTRDSRLPTGVTWPDKLDKETLKLLWRVDLESSYSGPIVTADRVFVTETVGKQEVVKALRRSDGHTLWKTSWEGQMTVPPYAKVNGDWIRATPVYDGASLYVGGMRDLLVSLNATTGKENWRVDFPKLYKTELPVFGNACSPLVDGDSVFVQVVAGVVALNKKSGKVLWRAELDKTKVFGAATSSPIIGTIAGKRQLIVAHRQVLAGLDLANGSVLWKHNIPAFRNTSTVTPVLLGDGGVFMSLYAGRSFRFDVSAAEGKQTVKTAWHNAANANMTTPVLIGDHLYLHLENRRIACLEVKTGKQTWRTMKTFGNYWSMVTNGDRILALDQDGTLYLLRANPNRYEQLDSRRISEAETWAHLAIVGDELHVRELKGHAVYRWKQPGASDKNK